MHFENLLLLRNAIIERAVDDYKSGYNRREVEEWLLSADCAKLLVNSDASGPQILEHLKLWAKKNSYKAYCKKRGRKFGDKNICRRKDKKHGTDCKG